MKVISIKITKFISDDQPGFVECKLNDVRDKEHNVQVKVPIVTEKYLDANSDYPQGGLIACEIIKQWIDDDKRSILTISTEKSWAVDTIDGLTEFDILEEQLTKHNPLQERR